MQEGIFDRFLGRKKEEEAFKILPKDYWVKLLTKSGQTVRLLANSPTVQDASSLVLDLVGDLENIDPMLSKKLAQKLRVNTKILKGTQKGDKEAAKAELIDLVKGMRKEADHIRSVRMKTLKTDSLDVVLDRILFDSVQDYRGPVFYEM
jgi:hypothetical protein